MVGSGLGSGALYGTGSPHPFWDLFASFWSAHIPPWKMTTFMSTFLQIVLWSPEASSVLPRRGLWWSWLGSGTCPQANQYGWCGDKGTLETLLYIYFLF